MKKNSSFAFAGAGIAIMLFGFLRWKKKEQDLRDKILEIEHIIKQKERDRKKKTKKKKSQGNPEEADLAIMVSELEKS